MRIHITALAFLAAFTAVAAMDVDPNDTSVTPGVWCGNFPAAKSYAEANAIPLVLVWGNKGCEECDKLTAQLKENEKLAWAKAQSAVFCFVEGENGNDVTPNKGAKEFAKTADNPKIPAPTGGFPYCCFYWQSRGAVTFTGRLNLMYSKNGSSLFEQFKNSFDAFVELYKRDPSYATFPFGDTVNDRLEAIAGKTTYVDVSAVRTNGVAVAATATLSCSYGGTVFSTAEIAWDEGEERSFVRVAIPSGFLESEQIELMLMDSDGVELARRHIWCVGEVENSPKNPLWMGERSADALAWGEWTMDLDIVTNKVAAWNAENPSQKAYALALVEGSCWCPDCAMTEPRLLDHPKFKDWASSNRIVFGVVDIPNNPSSTTNYPSLLTYTSYRTSDSYVTLRNSSPTNELMRYQSGAGYLSRHSIEPQDALSVIERNRFLMGNDTLNGGWNRPENKNKNRTGVPIFVLLREDGSIAGRWTRFNIIGPDEYSDGYLRRLEEVISLVEDPNEESNDHMSTTRETLGTDRLSVESSVSTVDNADVYALEGFDGYTVVTATVSVQSDAAGAELAAEIVDAAGTVYASSSGTAGGNFSVSAKVGGPSARYLRIRPGAITDGTFFGYTNLVSTVCGYRVDVAGVKSGGVIGFDEKTISVAEGSGSAVTQRVDIAVSRAEGDSGSASVSVRQTNPVSDPRIVWSDTILSWGDGESGVKTASLLVIDDDEAVGDIGLTFVLADAKGEAADTSIRTVAGEIDVFVLDDDTYGELAYRSVEYAQALAIDGWQDGDAVSVKRTSGTLPPGLSAKIMGGELIISGVPARAGRFSATFRVAVLRDGKTVDAQEIELQFTIRDPNPGRVIPSLASARTYANLPVVSAQGYVEGLLTLTVPTSGRLSAKYRNATGTVSFSCMNWDAFDPYGRLATATLTSARSGAATLAVALGADGGMAKLTLADESSVEIDLPADGWSETSPADAWKGQYTVQMPQTNIVDKAGDGRLGGVAYMAMRMDTKAKLIRGTMLYAGVLPNGRAVSGTSMLLRGSTVSSMPFLNYDLSDGTGFLLCGMFDIVSNASTRYRQERWGVRAGANIAWQTVDDLPHESDLVVYGGYYDKDSISECFAADYSGETDNFGFCADTATLCSGRHGDGAASAAVPAAVADNAPFLDDAADNPNEVELFFSPETGVISGTLYIPFEDGRRIAATYRGIALPGWQGCAACSEDEFVQVPWAAGACSFSDGIDGCFIRNGFEIRLDRLEQ